MRDEELYQIFSGKCRGQACKWQILSLLSFHWLKLSLMAISICCNFLFLSICGNSILFHFYLGYFGVLYYHTILINIIYVFTFRFGQKGICYFWM